MHGPLNVKLVFNFILDLLWTCGCSSVSFF